jgi:hypothetical protein
MIDSLASNVGFFCPIWTITSRDGVVAAYAAHTRACVGKLFNPLTPFTFNSITYGIAPSQSSRDMQKIGLSPNSTQFIGVFDDIITRADVEGGRWKLAKIVYEYVNYLDLSMGSTGKLVGVAGRFEPMGAAYQVEMMSNSTLLTQQVGELTSPTDRNQFPAGLSRTGTSEVQRLTSHGVPYTAGTFSITFTNPLTSVTQTTSAIAWNASAGTIQSAMLALSNMPASGVSCSGGPLNTAWVTLTFGGTLALHLVSLVVIDYSLITPPGFVVATTITQGSADWTFHRAVVSSADRRHLVIDGSAKADNYFQYGVITWQTGTNTHSPGGMEIKSNTGNTIELMLPMPADIIAGNQVTLLAGYDGTRTQCRDKFGDAINFNGEPDLPGLKVLFTYPE